MKRLFILFLLGMTLAPAGINAQEQITMPLDKAKPYLLNMPGIKSVLVSDESLVELSVKEDGSSLRIMPLHIGKTLMHVWARDGRRSFIINVTGPSYLAQSTRRQDAEPGFKIGVSMGQKSGDSASSVTANQYTYVSDYLVVDAFGNCPYGFLQTQLGYKIRQEKTGATGGLSNFKLSLEKDRTRIQLGDQSINYSEFVMPYQDIQGLSYSSRLWGANVSVMGGVNRSGWWGEDLYRDYRVKQNFWGANVVVPVEDDLFLGFNGVYKTDRNNPDTLALGSYAKYLLSKRWTANGEVGLSSGKIAAKAAVFYDDKVLNASAVYRHSPSGYRTASDFSSYGGLQGLFLNTFYRYNNHLSFAGKFDQYKNVDYNGSYDNQDLNTTTYFNYDKLSLSHAFWRQARGLYYGAGVGQGQNFESAYLVSMLNSRFYYRYNPTDYTNARSSSNNYSDVAQVAGIQFNGVHSTSLVLEKQWTKHSAEVESLFAFPEIYRAYLSIPQIMLYQNKLNGSLYFRYQESFSPSNNVIQNEGFFRARLDWRETSDRKFYAEMAITKISGISSLALDRTLTEYSFGTTYFWDTGVNLVPGTGVVGGVVFNDTNDNGVQDANENGLHGIRVRLGNGRETVTDINGSYKFVNLQGNKSTVSVAQEALASGYIFTTVADRVVDFDSDASTAANFGLTSRSLLQGIVFVDQNGNGLFDPGEKVVPDVKLEIKDITSAVSDFEGRFLLTGLPAGKQSLSVEIPSLPFDLVPAGPVTREIELVSGEKREIYFPLLAK